MICCSPKGVKDMIEIIYKEEQKKAGGNETFFRVPNNIRQIGEIRGHQRIYIEDYAYTFLRKISRNPQEGGKAAILLGQYNWSEGCAYLFIRSALQITDMEVSPDHIVFSDKVWGQIYEDNKKYFPDQEIVGWFASLPGFNMQISEGILKTHLNHFAGNDKVLFIMEPGEREEAFFLYEGGHLVRQPGYYIYYEKNEAMQAYMIEMSQNKSIEETEKVPDRAVVDFRRAVKEKKEKEQDEVLPGRKRTAWIAGACAAAAVLAVGITFFNSYQGMQDTMGTLMEGSSGEKQSGQEGGSEDGIQSAKADDQAGASSSAETDGQEESVQSAGTDSAGQDTGDGQALITPESMETGAQTDSQEDTGQARDGEETDEETAGSGTGTADESSVTGNNGENAAAAETTGEQENAGDGKSESADGNGSANQSRSITGSQSGSSADSQNGNSSGSLMGSQNSTDSASRSSQSGNGGETDASETAGISSGVRQYTIRRGDTLSSICEKQYGTVSRIDEVCRLNGISPEDIIYAGQKILLPE